MAFECSPYRGSEWAVGWGRLLQAARVAEVHVVTSEENFQALERAQSEGLVPTNVRFYTPPPDAKLRANDVHAGMFAYNYTAYHHWQKLALPLLRELHAREHFDVVHQVTVNTFREPSYGWTLGVPFLWGPVGGTQNFPTSYLSLLPPVEAAKEFVRALVNELSLRFKPRVRNAAKAAARVIASNSTNQRDYTRAFARPIDRLLETGLQSVTPPDRSRFLARVHAQQGGEAPPPLRLLWSGELQTRKALPILLRALATLNDIPWQLTILGDGPMRELWIAEAATLGLTACVNFAGRLPFPEAVEAMNRADLFCFTSLRDTSGNVVLEALAAGVPVLCFDHQGAGDMVSATCGIKLPITSPKQSIAGWATAIRTLAQDAPRLLQLSEGTTAQAESFLWNRNGDAINVLYEQLSRETMSSTTQMPRKESTSP